MSDISNPTSQTIIEDGYSSTGFTNFNSKFYFSTTNGVVEVFDTSFNYLNEMPGSNLLVSPQGLDNDGTNVWVADIGNSSVFKIAPDGTALLTLTTADGQALSSPYDVKVYNNVAYVSDADNLRICSFNATTGAFISAFDLPAISYARCIWINLDLLYVLDVGNRIIYVYDLLGNLQSTIGGPGLGVGQFDSPFGMIVDGENRVWVADNGAQKVCIFDVDGNVITEFKHSQGFLFESIGFFSYIGSSLYMTDQNPGGTSIVIWTWANFVPPISVIAIPTADEINGVGGQDFGVVLPGMQSFGGTSHQNLSRSSVANSFLEDVENRYKN